MKNLFYLNIILILLSLQIGYAQNPISFRSKALGGIIDDDLDLVYDPVELAFVKGIRIYTNLSNLTSYNEQIFNGISDKEFLLGISSKNPFVKSLWTSALVRFSNAQNSNYVTIDSDLDGWNDLTGNGILESNFTAFIDNNGDGNYDVKRIINQKKSNINQNKNHSFILNNAFNMKSMIIGLKFVYGSTYQENNVAHGDLGSGSGVLSGVVTGDASFSRSVTNTQIIQDYVNSDWLENGDFKTEFSSNYFNIAASGLMKNVRNYEVRADLAYNHRNTLNEVNDKYSGKYEYFDPNTPNYKNDHSEDDSYNSQNEEKGGGVFLGTTLRKTFDKRDQRKNDGYWRLGVGFFIGSYDYTNIIKNNFTSDENKIEGKSWSDYMKKINFHNEVTDNGDKSNYAYSTNFKINIPLGEKVYLGLGGFFNYSTVHRKTKYIESYQKTKNYTQVDNTPDYSDYAQTETSGITANRNYEISRVYFYAPVGIEYRFTKNKKWAIRFGSIFSYHSQNITDKKDIIKSDPYTYKITHGDGSSSSSVDDNKYTSTKEEIKTKQTNTLFSYGLGYNPIENIQIDLLGFFGNKDNSLLDADFYRSLRFSFTIKF